MAKLNITVGRYRGMIASIAVFLLMITLLLIFTFFASSRLEKNTALVNEANYVSNRAQSVIKDLFDLKNSYGESIRSPHMQRVLDRLETDSKAISNTLSTLQSGGNSHEGHGHGYDYALPEITNPELIKNIEDSKAEWGKLSPKVDAYLEHARDITVDSSDDLTLAVDQAKTSSLLINNSLNHLVEDVVKSAQSEASKIRTVQVAGVIIIFLYFVVFIFFFIRRLGQSDQEAIEARRETEEIMETVNTGLFLLDKDLMIGNQHSKALADIMGTNRLAGQNFASVLRNRISDKDLETTRQFIEQLYNPRVKTKLVNDLNPLNKVMLHNDDSGSVADRYLDFRFSRVYEGKTIARILVNVSDVTDAVLLEHKLEKEREQNDLQIEMLTTILNVSPKLINNFISNTNTRIESINAILKNPGSSQFELENKLKSIYREVHSLKGEASALKLHSFTNIATAAEDKLHELQNQGKLSGNDFLPLAVHLDDLLNLSNTIDILGQRINQATAGSVNVQVDQSASNEPSPVVSNSDELKSPPKIHNSEGIDASDASVSNTSASDTNVSNNIEASEEIRYYQDFVEQIAQRQQKQVELVTEGMEIQVPDRLDSALREISIQLVRNAIVHGIETPDVRQSNGKDAKGKLLLAHSIKNDTLILTVEDDGAGIDYQAIQHKLIALGYYDETSVQELSKAKLLNALFSSGFSTKDSADEDGGRGVGLDIIKDRIKTLNGKINVHSEAGHSTRFTISLPLSA